MSELINKLTYRELNEIHSKRLSVFNIKHALSKNQFIKECISLGVNSEKWDLEIVFISNFSFIRKVDYDNYIAVNNTNKAEMQKAMEDHDFCVSAFIYELNNTEYSYTWEIEDALYLLDLTYDDIENNPIYKSALETAKNRIRNIECC